MALGNIFKETREARGLTTIDVAEHTNMMVQIVEDIEKEDFHRIAAPIYGRGFLKLYAELLKIDAQPLIDEFMEIYAGNKIPAVRHSEAVAQDSPRIPAARAVEGEETAEEDSAALSAPPDNSATEAAAGGGVDADVVETGVRSQPGRAPVVARPALRTLDEPPPAQPEIRTQPRTAADSEIPALFNADVPIAACDERVPDARVSVQSAGADGAESPVKAPPAAGSALFGEDEPNLFNAAPLHERLAEARRLMDEKEGAEPEEKPTKVSLSMGTNRRLPVFQIGGRMDTVYETESRRKRAGRRRGPSRFSIDGFGGFFRRLTLRLPFDLNFGRSIVFAYGALVILALVLVFGGIRVIYRLTRTPDSEKISRAGDAGRIIPEKSAEIPVEAIRKTEEEGRVPPPPDLYLD